MVYLERLQSPMDLKTMGLEELGILAQELRDTIVRTVAKNGGHLAPSLGVVELALALHAVFDSPRDRIVWDVGHQAYAHKLLTGRLERFDSLRQAGGVSGFLRRSESPHDAFGAGHASTSISAALGMAKARDLAGADYHVVAVIGDGALTGGLAYEGLNHAGSLGTRLIVILNDNSMSISPNVGALSAYLTRLRSGPVYGRIKQDVEGLLKAIPLIGDTMAAAAERVRDSVRSALIPGQFFEELGLSYFGPIDGHSIPLLRSVLERAKGMEGPVLLHVITRKGEGYGYAEADPGRFHGLPPFDPETGKALGASAGPGYSQVFGQTMVELGETVPGLVAITAAMPDGTGLAPFARRFPERFFDVGIAEGHALTFAAGLAAEGIRPVVAVYSTFLQRAYDQIIHDVALQELPVILALDRAGLVGEDGATHHGSFDLAYLSAVPGMVVAAPRDLGELRRLLFTAVHTPLPFAIRYPKGMGSGDPHAPLEAIPVGQAEILREGDDIALLALGSMVGPALEAADLLAAQGRRPTVVDVRFLKPLDTGLLRRILGKAPAVVTVEEGVRTGGLGSAVALFLEEMGRSVPLATLALPDVFVEQGTREDLLEELGLSARGILDAVNRIRPLSGVARRRRTVLRGQA